MSAPLKQMQEWHGAKLSIKRKIEELKEIGIIPKDWPDEIWDVDGVSMNTIDHPDSRVKK